MQATTNSADSQQKRSKGNNWPAKRETELDERISPHSVEAEQALLAACLQDGGEDSIGRCIEEKVFAKSFYKPAHRKIFEAMTELFNNGEAVEELVVGEKLSEMGVLDEVGGYAYLSEMSSRIRSRAHLPYYIRRVRDTALLRELIRTCTETIENALEGNQQIEHFLGDVEQRIFQLSEARVSDAVADMRGMVKSATEQVQRFLTSKGEVLGVPSGFVDLDAMTTGFHPPQMVVVAARPGMGKTSMALNMAEAAILPPNGKATPTLMFSLEMGSSELALRLLCSRAGVNTGKLKDGFLSREKNQDLVRAAKELETAPLYVDDSANLNILEIRAKARRLKPTKKLGLIVIDYLQLVHSTDASLPRHEQLGEVSRGIKGMAKELELPVIALCQLNRETEKEKRQPRMSDLRESGSIEQDADMVLLISKPMKEESELGEENPTVVPRELIIAKQRSGPTGSIPLTFNPSLTRFQNAARNP